MSADSVQVPFAGEDMECEPKGCSRNAESVCEFLFGIALSWCHSKIKNIELDLLVNRFGKGRLLRVSNAVMHDLDRWFPFTRRAALASAMR